MARSDPSETLKVAHPTLGERLDSLSKRQAGLALLLFFSLVLSALFTVGQAGAWVLARYEDRFLWRSETYRNLEHLRAGFAIDAFEERLGSPLFKRRSGDGLLVEYTFQGRDHWVQAIADGDDVVQRYAVTSCDASFRPRFQIPSGPLIELRRTTFAEAEGHTLHYFVAAATANTSLFESIGGGNPMQYKSFSVGLNDACPDWHESRGIAAPVQLLREAIASYQYDGPVEDAPRGTERFRRQAVVNTYVESAPAVFRDEEPPPQVDPPWPNLGMGVDRLLVRTVTGFG